MFYLSKTHQYEHSIHRNCIGKVHQNDVEFSPIKITVKKVHRNDVDFLHIEITSNKTRPNNVYFSPFKVTSKNFLEMTWKFVDIFFWPIEVISTSNWRRFDVLCPLGTQLFIVPPVEVTLELFQSQRPKKPTLKST